MGLTDAAAPATARLPFPNTVLAMMASHRAKRVGEVPIWDRPTRLRCTRCGARPGQVVIADNTRGPSYGPARKLAIRN